MQSRSNMYALWLLLLAGCVSIVRTSPVRAIVVQAPFDAGVPVVVPVVVEVVEPDAGAVIDAELDTESSGGEEPGEAIAGDDEPQEVAPEQTDGGLLYSADLSDEELARRWREAPAELGSLSMGFVEEGRLINGVPFPQGEAWTVVSPEATWGTSETVGFVAAAIEQVRAWFPDAPKLRVNQISAREGGYLRPHKTHQNGRDVDLGFYYPGGETVRVREREKVIDVAKNWALVKALVIHGDVQFILVDQRVQKVLFEYAMKAGEDPQWLESLFHSGRASMLQHARRHRDHFHVRYFNKRAQELGVRVAPLLAVRPEENLALHRVRKGDTLGGIASRYGSGVAAIKKASGLTSNLLRIGRVLKVPLRKPCTTCPVPPLIVVPPRRLPPSPPSVDAGAESAIEASR